MKIYLISIFIFLGSLLFSQASPDYHAENLILKTLRTNLKFLNEKEFLDKPGAGYLWVTVLHNEKKAIFICPEDGLGEGVLVYGDGTVMSRGGRDTNPRLCYTTLVKPLSEKKWHKLNLGKGWTQVKVDKDKPLGLFVTEYFGSRYLRAIHNGK